MNENVIKAMNDQINLEMYSGYLYLALAIQMEKKNYKGYYQWLSNHYFEELRHAQDFIRYLQKRNVSAELQDIKVEKVNYEEPLEVAKAVLVHEKKVTENIYKLHDVCKKYNDYATEIFLHGYISEQIEEEDIALEVIDKFAFAGSSTAAKYAVDRELVSMGARQDE